MFMTASSPRPQPGLFFTETSSAAPKEDRKKMLREVKRALSWWLVAGAVRAFGGGTDFPAVYNSERDTNAVLISPGEALSKLQLPAGFKATMFAAEPDVQNPIGMAWDAKGRLWVAENYTYAERGPRFDFRLRDRIIIFEDADG